MNQLQKDLQSVLKSLSQLTQKVKQAQKRLKDLGKKRPAVKSKSTKAAPKKKTAARTVRKVSVRKKGAPTAFETVLGIIKRSKRGVNVAQLKAKTRFDDKKIANLIYKAKKQRKIKSKVRGIYMTA